MSKTILIVGSSRGIGKELVLNLSADSNNHVIALSRNIEAMDNSFKKDNIDYYQFDLSSKAFKKDLSLILANYATIDILINNAGCLINKPFLELTREDFKQSYEVNAISVMQTTQHVVPKMIEKGGHIVNISTMGAFQGSVKFPGLLAYSTSKAAVTSFTELFSEEYKDSKIAMNCLCLGAAQTEMLEEAFPGYKAPLSAKEMATYIADFALNAHNYIKGKIIPVSLSTP